MSGERRRKSGLGSLLTKASGVGRYTKRTCGESRSSFGGVDPVACDEGSARDEAAREVELPTCVSDDVGSVASLYEACSVIEHARTPPNISQHYNGDRLGGGGLAASEPLEQDE